MGAVTETRKTAIVKLIQRLFSYRFRTGWGAWNSYADGVMDVLVPYQRAPGAPSPGVSILNNVGDLYCDTTTGNYYRYTPTGWAPIAFGTPGTIDIEDDGTPVGAASTLNFVGAASISIAGAAVTVEMGGDATATFSDDDGGGNTDGLYRETLPAADPFPTSIIWWTSAAKITKVREKFLTYTGVVPTTVQWKFYTSGVLSKTITDTVTYSGVYETSRARVIS